MTDKKADEIKSLDMLTAKCRICKYKFNGHDACRGYDECCYYDRADAQLNRHYYDLTLKCRTKSLTEALAVIKKKETPVEKGVTIYDDLLEQNLAQVILEGKE